MGLIHFPGTRKGEVLDNFAVSTQRVLSAVWKGQGDRLRWRLEPWKGGPMPTCVHGRSAEAAVACAAVSVVYRRSPKTADAAGLNPTIGITATMEENGEPFEKWPVGPVHEQGMSNKLTAAANRGLGEVLIHTAQRPKEFPQHKHPYRVATLGDAYFEMQLTNRFIRNHLARVAAEFDQKWHLEETPQ